MSEELKKAKDSLLSAANAQNPIERAGYYRAALAYALVALVEELEKLNAAKGGSDG